ncbi:cyclopropane-fatty-acyl-phospholipid synthase family protein [Hyphomicrobium sp.]|uniref:SAM-dependent methyltransferase n=1 Tax=Hyphomicrobium sp. TaxID=82 RepID=UPI000F9F9CD0|nr:cyclopropane-fatty-acyl-phospholipid synthase family protein [Hyphomicrobium sp.]MBN9248676.1 class I SAM-dependent methyltransferase [Hyphomicrobium sp.]RUP11017.1 MAG: class I SAM-dependent methyltransferase [Hyphomicrobium sp.]
MAAKDDKQLEAARALVRDLAGRLNTDGWVRLWDGTRLPLGSAPKSDFEISIRDPGVIGAILRSPSLDSIIRQYVEKGIDFSGGTLVDFGLGLQDGRKSVKMKPAEFASLALKLSPFLFAKTADARDAHGFEGEITGKNRKTEDNRAYIQFHYDLSNDFYALFLDPEMVYSCAYYTDWSNGVEQAQHDKLEMICRKLRLKPGERMLDIGAGWGGLLCHAAKNYGVVAHGVTLSEEQLAFARAKAKRLGIDDRVTFELNDYSKLTGTYDKIASIGMYEHIGLKNIPAYMSKVRSLLADEGLFLNHAISRRAHKPKTGWLKSRMRPEKKAIAKYIFPGGELDDIGHSIAAMERAGFEVHDVEGWRLHYARTCQLWCERLTANREQAIAYVGEEKYRIWVAYLAGVSLAFSRGTLRLFQTLASKSAKRNPVLPPTRADLYR